MSYYEDPAVVVKNNTDFLSKLEESELYLCIVNNVMN